MGKKAPKKRDGVYQRKDRKGFWISWTDAQGNRRQRKTDAQNITQAKQILSAELLRVEQAKMLGRNPPGEETFREVCDRYMKYQKARLKTQSYRREEGIRRNHLGPRFDDWKLSAIRKADLQRYLTDRAAVAGAGAGSIRKELAMLTHIFRLAVEWEIIPINPAVGLKAPKVPAGRVRYLQPTELKALLEAARDGLREIIALAVSTGMRRGEIMGLRHLDVDMANRRILLPQTKNGDSRVVYLNDMAMMVLRSMPDGAPGDLIFSDWTPDMVTTAFGRLCRELKISDFRFHDLRHTAASWMRMAGADTQTVAQLLGHKDTRSAIRYQHLSPAFLADAVCKLDGVFGDSMAAMAIGVKTGEDVTVALPPFLGTGADGGQADSSQSVMSASVTPVCAMPIRTTGFCSPETEQTQHMQTDNSGAGNDRSLPQRYQREGDDKKNLSNL